MRGRLRALRRHPLTYLGVALYAVFLITVPFQHHDLECELKTPMHCTACTSSAVASDPHTPVIVGSWSLADVGSAVVFQSMVDGILRTVPSIGRAPPA
jgi:hypothetical protein